MSIARPHAVNHSLVKSYRTVCFDHNLVISQGVFLGDNPFHSALPLLLFEISLIFLVSTAIHRLLRPLGQSRTVSQILTGILLGRSALGRSLPFNRTVFPIRGTFILDTISLLGLILFVFSIGVKTDLSLLKRPGRRAVVIGIAGSFIPLVLIMTMAHYMESSFPTDLREGSFVFQLIARLSLSSFAVIADALDELGLLNSDLGRVAMSGTLITDIMNWFIATGLVAMDFADMSADLFTAVSLMIPLLFFTAGVVFIARPIVLCFIRRTPPGELLGDGSFIALLLGALFAAFFTETAGYHVTLGPFLLGLALPGGMPLGVTLTEKLDSFLMGLFLPLYLVLAGYRTDFSEMRSVKEWGYLELVFIACYVGKLACSVLAAICFKMPMRDALTVALIMNIKGLIEVSFFNSWGDTEVATAQHFSVLMVALLLSTAFTTPLVKFLYDPMARYMANKRRTIQHAKPRTQLRVIACIHNEDNVASLLDLLEASHPTRESPISVFVLHLTELVGRAASVLRPIKKSKNQSNPTASDRIANAFRYFEQESEGAITVHPYVAIAPYATIHDDVCSLSLDRKARLIILPFHRQSDGIRETARHSIRGVNNSVLDYAPCSVAIYVDRGVTGGSTCTHTNRILQRIVVFFLGGADDREALAYGTRMAANDSVSLTVVRFVLRGEVQRVDQERRLDDEMLLEFQALHVKNNAVGYIEKMVVDGEGTVAVLRSMSEKFDLLIVGRRKDMESKLTSGMSEWSECPELGLVGDLLSSIDFGTSVSILVVQQGRVLGG